jgi:hypothetical protein
LMIGALSAELELGVFAAHRVAASLLVQEPQQRLGTSGR